MKLRDIEKNPLPNQYAADRRKVESAAPSLKEGDIVLVCVGEQTLKWCLINEVLEVSGPWIATVTRHADPFWCSKTAPQSFRRNVVKVTLANIIDVRQAIKREAHPSQITHTKDSVGQDKCLACGSGENKLISPYPLCAGCFNKPVFHKAENLQLPKSGSLPGAARASQLKLKAAQKEMLSKIEAAGASSRPNSLPKGTYLGIMKGSLR